METKILALVIVSVLCLSAEALRDVSPFNSTSEELLGHWANEGQIPYQVSIKSISPSSGVLRFCSGIVISMQWVLTVASCVVQSQTFVLRFGALTHYTNGEAQLSFDAFVHPFYNPHNHTNDIALIAIPRPLSPQNNTRVTFPTLADSRLNFTERLAVVSGWGRGPSGGLSPVLTYAYAQLVNINNETCQSHWVPGNQNPISNQNIPTNPAFVCANVLLNSQRENACYGDRGTPLVVFENRRWILLGLSIFDANDGRCRNSTNLYTRVIDARQFITNITRLTFN